MFLNILIAMLVAGFVMLLWHRVVVATSFGVLSWPFKPLEHMVAAKYNSNIRFVFGLVLWIPIALILAADYWFGVEQSYFAYYTFGSGLVYGFAVWLFTILIVFPLTKQGFAGLRLGSWAWLESLVAWLLFGIVFGLIIS